MSVLTKALRAATPTLDSCPPAGVVRPLADNLIKTAWGRFAVSKQSRFSLLLSCFVAAYTSHTTATSVFVSHTVPVCARIMQRLTLSLLSCFALFLLCCVAVYLSYHSNNSAFLSSIIPMQSVRTIKHLTLYLYYLVALCFCLMCCRVLHIPPPRVSVCLSYKCILCHVCVSQNT